MKLDRDTLQPIKSDILAELERVAKKHNVKFSFQGGSFDGDTATLRLHIQTVSADGEVATKESGMYKSNAAMFGLKPEWLGKEFALGSGRYKLSGMTSTGCLTATDLGRGREVRFKSDYTDKVAAALAK